MNEQWDNEHTRNLCGDWNEHPSRGDGVVVPALLKGFHKKVGADGLQIVAEEVTEPEVLFGLRTLFPFEQQPARLFQEGRGRRPADGSANKPPPNLCADARQSQYSCYPS
jgi:hypothetical protein